MRSLIFCLFSLFALNTWGGQLQQALDQARQENNVSAMQMTLILPTQENITVSSGTIEKNPKSPKVMPDTLFQIGSNTKSFTSALMLKLQEQKKLSLSDTVGKYFPQYKNWSNVTLSQLLHNNSGIPSYSENKDFQKELFANPNRIWKTEELTDIAYKLPLDFPRGQGWHYSNTNFVLAGMIAEKVMKKPLKELFETYFFKPLNLTHTYYITTAYPANTIKQMAHGYDAEGKDITHGNMSWGAGAGAIVSNSTDLANWTYALFHNKVLTAASMQQMLDLVSTKTGLYDEDGQEGYGMGVGMRIDPKDGKWYGHEGETIGFHAIMIWFPHSNLTVAILTNGAAPKLRDFAVTLPGLVG